ncbi:long-chain fatty acid--CoA ligase [Georgenia yuyongxinii]|uniref:Long-chain fatty acid--CoA ligase n=1 Tax=Georgenia yuyongxinii TaxID=2589797 RepID=A0A5B8C1U4_9MICO|nr:long-chain fatty acid--CoA ligase [Georgenia yuyongxinii]QDC24020.1 long-chain fatty acid--CoA ligase [Georgenia yuyongxinii]
MRDQGIGSWPARRCKNGAHRTALVHGERTDTYADVERRTRQLANALRADGVGRGDRVAFVGFNHPALLETFFAVGQLGAIWVIINARLTAPEVEYILADSGATVVVYGPEHAGHAAKLAHLPGVRTWVAVEPDDGAADAPSSALSYEAFLAAGATDVIDEPVSWDDPAMIMYTSGTTGRPKGAVHTHGSLHMQYFNVLVDLDVARDDVTLAVAPMFHVAGLNMLTLPTFLKGGKIIIQPGFKPDRVLATIAAEKVTSVFAVPAMMDALASHPDFAATDLSSLTNVVVGGSPLPDRMLRTWAARGIGIQQGFGMTETAPGIYLLTAEDSLRKPSSAGRNHFFTEGRVVRLDGTDVAPGENGEVIGQGPNVMQGYWNNSGATAEAIVDGWYHTGDVATVDEDGYIYIRDRLKDMYISGGENVYPAEVENALLDLPGVAEAAVIGVPDPRWGEVGHAYVVAAEGATLTAEDVVARLTERLAKYKVPKEVVFVDELPRTATGKLQKHLIRTRFQESAL